MNKWKILLIMSLTVLGFVIGLFIFANELNIKQIKMGSMIILSTLLSSIVFYLRLKNDFVK